MTGVTSGTPITAATKIITRDVGSSVPWHFAIVFYCTAAGAFTSLTHNFSIVCLPRTESLYKPLQQSSTISDSPWKIVELPAAWQAVSEELSTASGVLTYQLTPPQSHELTEMERFKLEMEEKMQHLLDRRDTLSVISNDSQDSVTVTSVDKRSFKEIVSSSSKSGGSSARSHSMGPTGRDRLEMKMA